MTSNKRSILVVDDEPEMLKILEYKFGQMEFEIFSALNVPEAIAILEKTPVRILLTDVNLPGTLGTELIDWLIVNRSEKERPFIFLMTGYIYTEDDASWEKNLLEKGVLKIFRKPFTLKDLTETILLLTDL